MYIYCIRPDFLACLPYHAVAALLFVCNVSECHGSCKHTCFEGGPAGCDDCRDGWLLVDDVGCVGL